MYARNSPVRAKALTFTPLLTSFECSKNPPSDHTDHLDAKHDGPHIIRMTWMIQEQRHPTVSDHLDATVYRLLTHIYIYLFVLFLFTVVRRLTEQITQVLRDWECVGSMFIWYEQQTSEFFETPPLTPYFNVECKTRYPNLRNLFHKKVVGRHSQTMIIPQHWTQGEEGDRETYHYAESCLLLLLA